MGETVLFPLLRERVRACPALDAGVRALWGWGMENGGSCSSSDGGCGNGAGGGLVISSEAEKSLGADPAYAIRPLRSRLPSRYPVPAMQCLSSGNSLRACAATTEEERVRRVAPFGTMLHHVAPFRPQFDPHTGPDPPHCGPIGTPGTRVNGAVWCQMGPVIGGYVHNVLTPGP